MTCAVYMYTYLLVYDFFEVSRTQFAVLFLANAMVFMGELFNTAVEALADLMEDKYSRYCAVAKDVGAGAVLTAAAFAVAVGIAILGQGEAFRQLFLYYRENPAMIAVLAVSFVLSGVFMFWPSKNKKNKKDGS
ncbi:MAG: diacylglycerol kinase family protein [Oscillospiraceae bacterium]|nr:diacylglycerol kinase family protein [Oscillospiraceae bacterium]